jgi:hypothetical protein
MGVIHPEVPHRGLGQSGYQDLCGGSKEPQRQEVLSVHGVRGEPRAAVGANFADHDARQTGYFGPIGNSCQLPGTSGGFG